MGDGIRGPVIMVILRRLSFSLDRSVGVHFQISKLHISFIVKLVNCLENMYDKIRLLMSFKFIWT